ESAKPPWSQLRAVPNRCEERRAFFVRRLQFAKQRFEFLFFPTRFHNSFPFRSATLADASCRGRSVAARCRSKCPSPPPLRSNLGLRRKPGAALRVVAVAASQARRETASEAPTFQ